MTNAVLALVLLSALVGEPEPMLQAFVPPPAAEFDPYSVVSVCPIPSRYGPWAVAWHVPPGVDSAKAKRAVDELKDPAFSDCLARFVHSDPATLALVKKAMQGIDTSVQPPLIDWEAATASNDAVRKRWTAFGVDEAIREVAETGLRGDRVAKVLAACEQLAAAEQKEGGTP